MGRADPKPIVMVVDDEESVRKVVRRILESEEYHVLEAPGGAEALKALDEGTHCDLLVADLAMPGMQGDEMARRFLAARPDLKVLYVSGFTDLLFERGHSLWEQEAFLDKPFTPKGLTEAVFQLLHGRLQGAFVSNSTMRLSGRGHRGNAREVHR